jgi:hypothetical protein
MYPFLKNASFRPCFCFVHTIAQFSRMLRFSHIYCQIFSRVPFVDGSGVPLNSECINFNDRVRKVPKIYYFGAIFWNHDQKKMKLPVHRYSYMVKYLIKFVVIINRRWEKLIYLSTGSFFLSWSWFQILRQNISLFLNHIGGIMVTVLASSAVDRVFESRSGQTKYYKIGIFCFSEKHGALKRKNKDWLTRNQDNMSEWGDMSIRGLLF